MKNEFISVVVPIYMVEKYLQRCIESLLGQDYPDYEIILVDDGSQDQSPTIADEYAEKYQNITTYHKKNGGLGDARNFGVRHARGEWIAFIDSDDYVSSSYLSDMAYLLNKFDADLAITRIERIREGEKRSSYTFKEYCCSAEEAIEEAYFYGKVGWEAVGKLLKKEYLLKNPFPVGYYEDCACMYRIFSECNKIAIGSYVENYSYISREGSILQTSLKPEHMHIFEICEEFSKFYAENYPQNRSKTVLLYRKAVIQLLTCQKMEDSQFSEVYKMFASFFRKNLIRTWKDKRLNFPSKVYYVMLCTNPEMFKLFLSIKNLKHRVKI